MPASTPVLIVGAGPFGLALAAYLDSLGLEYRMHGAPMGFWRDHMPHGMVLRSACDWHLDPLDIDSIEAYLATRGLTPADVEPLTLDFYLEYATWFQQRKGLHSDPRLLRRLDGDDAGGFIALLDDGETITADKVVLAVGFRYFSHIPDDVEAVLPATRLTHTCELVHLAALEGRRCLILGGRQSAFEWAALLLEAGAASVDVCHRHPSPAFTTSDWSWANPLVDAMVDEPGWYRSLSRADREAVGQRLWAEGRLKVEPWLASRLADERARIHPDRHVTGSAELADGGIDVTLDNGSVLQVDDIVLATGYKPDLARVPFFAVGNLPARLELTDGFPALDESFQTTVPGLFATSMLAVHDFGPFFAFTISVRTSAKIIGRALSAQAATVGARTASR